MAKKNTGTEHAIDVAHAVGDIALTDAELKEIGEFAVNLIVLRTKSGKDADGVRFIPYSKNYKEHRKEHGLSTSPDLVVTGRMLGALTELVTGKNEVTLLFNDRNKATIASVHNYGSKKTRAIRKNERSAYMRREESRLTRQGASEQHIRETVAGIFNGQRGITPKREFMDIKDSKELRALEEVVAEIAAAHIKKAFES